MPTLRTVAGATAVALVLSAAGISPGVAASPSVLGAEGIGDPYFPTYGNGGYSASHYDINDTFTPASGVLSGTTIITARATESLSAFDLDFVLATQSVTVNGEPATFGQFKVTKPAGTTGGELVVTPAHGIPQGTSMTIVVTYQDHPANVTVGGYSPWQTTPTGALIPSEPESAAWWYPSNDHPLDKATFDISVTSPSALSAISNGVLVGKSSQGANTTWHWRENLPMATYLAFMAVGDYTVTSTVTASGLPFVTAIEGARSTAKQRTAATNAATDLARTPEIVDWLATQWGPYPFDAIGGVAPNSAYGDGNALENQTRPTYPSNAWQKGSDLMTVVHENAHQWFGDSVSVSDWSGIWLNEGFATFSEWLWTEQHGGPTAQQQFDQYFNQYPAQNAFWKVPIGNPGVAKLFADPIYFRGAMTLQALRNRVGNATFYQIMRSWASGHAYSNACIGQFEALAAQLSGQNLDQFFQTWLRDTSRPAASTANGIPKTSRSTIRPVLSTPPMPASTAVLPTATMSPTTAKVSAACPAG